MDRLFILLEGSSPVTRKAAAKQIGEIQKLHPHELHNLLNRLIVYIHSNNWETRVAASQAVQAILENVPQWSPKGAVIKRELSSEDGTFDVAQTETRLSFEKFNLDVVLENGARLMGSEGSEFDIVEENDNLNNREMLIKQRALLNDKLGFSAAKNLGINLDEMVTLEDMITSRQPEENTNDSLISVQDIINNQSTSSQVSAAATSMSCREINRAKRKARQNQLNSVSSSPSLSRSNSVNLIEEPERKKIKAECNGKVFVSTESVPDGTGSWMMDAVEWPLEPFCTKLYLDLFSPRWEVRHGSATSLRELLKSHIDGGGRSTTQTSLEMEESHAEWLEDGALRILCVLALDRFGDFVSDQVVAPVRETCAQVLGTILKQMPIELVHKTVEILQKFIKQKDWEVRHGGILGIKYMVVVREDLIQTFLPLIIKDILNGLLDKADDVSAVSALALIPIATQLPKLLSPKQVSYILSLVWDLLVEHQDELSSACNSFMGLLAAILSLPNSSQWIEMESMSLLIPRLWPFLSHSTSSVRRSTLQTLKKLTDNTSITKVEGNPFSPAQSQEISIGLNGNTKMYINYGVRNWPAPLLQEALRQIYQRVLVEHVEDIQSSVEEVWHNLVVNADLSTLLHAACPYVSCWLCLAMQPSRLAFDQNLVVHAKPTNPKRARGFDLNDSGNLPLQKLFLGGTESIPQDVRERNVVRARFKASRMIGLLSKYLVLPAPGVLYTESTESPIDCYTKVLLGYLQSRSSLQRHIASMVITFWAQKDPSIAAPQQLQECLRLSLNTHLYYDEISVIITRLLQESRDFLATLKQYKVMLPEFETCTMLSMEQIRILSTTATEDLKVRFNLKTKIAVMLEERRKSLNQSYIITSNEQNHLNISTQSSLAAAVVRLHCLPEKLNPVVKPLMESIKREECVILQKLSADSLTFLMSQIVSRQPSPNAKIVTNLCALLKTDEDFTPKIVFPDKELQHYQQNNDDKSNPYYGVITLENQQKTRDFSNGACSSGTQTIVTRGPGRPSALDIAIDVAVDIDDPVSFKIVFYELDSNCLFSF